MLAICSSLSQIAQARVDGHRKPVYSDTLIPRDLAMLCERVNLAAPQIPDRRLLSFTICSSRCILPAQEFRVT